MKKQIELSLSPSQLNILKHSLGLNESKQIKTFKKKKDSYRNRFCAGTGHSDYTTLKELCDLEIMDHGEPIESIRGDMYFYVTDKGIDELLKFL